MPFTFNSHKVWNKSTKPLIASIAAITDSIIHFAGCDKLSGETGQLFRAVKSVKTINDKRVVSFNINNIHAKVVSVSSSLSLSSFLLFCHGPFWVDRVGELNWISDENSTDFKS